MVKLGVQRKTKVIRVRLEPHTYALLRQKATLTKQSISAIIRFYIRKGLKEDCRK